MSSSIDHSSGLGFRVEGLGFRVQGLGLRVEGLGSRVEGLGLRALRFQRLTSVLDPKTAKRSRVEGLGPGMARVSTLNPQGSIMPRDSYPTPFFRAPTL